MIDRAKFLAVTSQHMRALNKSQKDGFNSIIDEWERRALTDHRWLAYIFATTWHETACTMQPIREWGQGKGRKYGTTYYGRGYVQLTWKVLYAKLSKLVGVDLVAHPDLALVPANAAKIMFDGMIDGLFTGKRLDQYFNKTVDSPVQARRIINGLDKAALIAGYHKNFLAALG